MGNSDSDLNLVRTYEVQIIHKKHPKSPVKHSFEGCITEEFTGGSTDEILFLIVMPTKLRCQR
jgi:hypothetical protein